jgi:hypothetical protein
MTAAVLYTNVQVPIAIVACLIPSRRIYRATLKPNKEQAR